MVRDKKDQNATQNNCHCFSNFSLILVFSHEILDSFISSSLWNDLKENYLRGQNLSLIKLLTTQAHMHSCVWLFACEPLCKRVSVCVRACVFVNRKYEDACSQRTQSHGISHSDRVLSAQPKEASREWVVCVFPFPWVGPFVVWLNSGQLINSMRPTESFIITVR